MPDKGKDSEKYSMQTRMVHGDWKQMQIDYSRALVPPISSAVTYSMDTEVFGGKKPIEFLMELEDFSRLPFYHYQRFDDPTWSLLEHKIAAAEGGETALVFATGMAAVTAGLMLNVSAGDEIVFHHAIYGNSHALITETFPRFGVKSIGLDFCDESALAAAINEKTRIVYFETPVNPLVNVVDIAAVRRIVDEAEERLGRKGQILVIADNTFPSPFCQRPLEHGVDIVVCSLTKSIAGFGADMGGALIIPDDMRPALVMHREVTGGIISPKVAWNIMMFGLPTLKVRMKTMQESALKIATFLADHSKIRKVNYPGLESHPQHEIAKRQMRDYNGEFAPGSMLYFELDTDDDRAIERFTQHAGDHSYSIALAVSLGHITTLLENPYNMTHLLVPEEDKKAMGLKPSGMRFSVGLEDPDDIMQDLRESLDMM